MRPFQQMPSHQVLESQRRLLYDVPIPVVMLLLLLDRADARGAERREPMDRVETIENLEPVRDRLVRELQDLLEAVRRATPA